MPLCLVVPAPFSAVSGGYAYDRRMVEGLRARGHAVRVAELPGRFPVPDAAAEAAAWQALAERAEDETVIIDGLALPAFAHVAEALESARAVGLIHHPTPLETGLSDPEAALLREKEAALLPRLSSLIATSRTTARQLGEMGIAPGRITVIEPGTEDAPRAEGSRSAGCAILSVGGLVPRKGHDLLLRALGRLADLPWQLTIAGSPERDRVHAAGLAALAEELGIARRVTFAGEGDDAALATLWRGTDLFALATWHEGYGMAVAEALTRGVPLARTAGGAAAELAPTEASVIVPAGDWTALSRAMRRLLFDGELRRRMADHAWEAGRKLPGWEAQAEAFCRAVTEAGA